MSIRNIITKHYQHSNNPNPIWRKEHEVKTVVYEFDYTSPITGEMFKTNLLWKHDTKDDATTNPKYHGCSWHFMKYNPTPVTDWFRGLPVDQMLKWCEEHGLGNMKVIGKYTDIYYHDICQFDDYNLEYYNPETGEVVG